MYVKKGFRSFEGAVPQVTYIVTNNEVKNQTKRKKKGKGQHP